MRAGACKIAERCYIMEQFVEMKSFSIQENIMGQQLNKVIKRRRRKAYLDRQKEKVQAAIAAKAKKK